MKDVTKYIDTFESPLKRGTYSKNVWDMQVFEGRVYIGQGNSANTLLDSNMGPIPVNYFDPVIDKIVEEYIVDEEQIDIFKIINNQLYIPGHDSRDSWDYGNFYRKNKDGWEKIRSIPNGLHIYDMCYNNGILFSALGTLSKYPSLYYSKDMGVTWIPANEPGELKRAYNVFEFRNDVYALQGVSTVKGSFYVKRFDGEKFVDHTDTNYLIPGLGPIVIYEPLYKINITHHFYKLIRINKFKDSLVYIVGAMYNDHQTKPLKMFVSTELDKSIEVFFPDTKEIPMDILVREGYALLLTNIKTEDDVFINIVYKTNDFNILEEILRFNAKTFARSFEELNGDFYFGLGTELDPITSEGGKIMRVKKEYINKSQIDSLEKINVAKGKKVTFVTVYDIGADGVTPSTNHSVEIDLGGVYNISEMRTYFGFNGLNKPVSQYKLKCYNGNEWITHLEVNDNKDIFTLDTFSPISASKVRWETEDINYEKMYEIEILGCVEKNDWKLVWSEEFNGNVLDMNKWSFHKSQYSNNEQSYYSGENVIVDNGNLILKAERKSNVHNKPYVSGAIDSRTKFSQKYGRFEMRAKLPVGQGYWPAFWLMPETMNDYGPWPASGEIDIMETGGDVNRYVGTIHYAGLNNQHKASSTGSVQLPNGGLNSDYHIYAVEWEPKEIRWYCDDVLMGKTNTWNTYGPDGQVKRTLPAPFDKNFYIILNLAVGGDFVGNKLPLEGNEQGIMTVDYVRVYSKDEYEMPVIEDTEEIDKIELVPSGINLIKNGNFDINTNIDWSLDGKNGIKAPTIINGELVVEIEKDIYEQHLQSIKYNSIISIEKDKKYRLRLKGRSNKNVKHVRPAIDRPTAGWSKIFLYSSLDFNTEMKEYIMDFTSTVTDSSARLLLYMGLMSGDVGGGSHTLYFDDISLEELVQKPFVEDPSKVVDKINVAKDKIVKVDSTYGNYVGSNAVNGDILSDDSRWVSENTSEQHFIEIYLGGQYTISEIRTYFGFGGYNRAPAQYKLKYFDGQDWVLLLDVNDNINPTPVDRFDPITTSAVRWETDSDGHVRMYEIEIMGN